MLKKIPLLVQVLIAVVLGILLGRVLPEVVVRALVTIQSIFAQYLGFCVPLIIVGLVVSGIAGMGKNFGKVLLLTVAIAYSSTLFSGFMTYFSCSTIFPHVLDGCAVAEVAKTESLLEKPFFEIQIPPMLNVMSALVFAFLMGIGISTTNSTRMSEVAEEFRKIMEWVITATIVPLLPMFIFTIFTEMSATGTVWEMIQVFGRIILVVFALHYFLLALQYTLAGAISGKNPLRAFWQMLPAYFTALGTSSSAATIPVTLAQTLKVGVRPQIANFCVPLCATIHLAGSTMKITAFSIAVVLMAGGTPTLANYSAFILLLGVTMVAAPGVPGGAIMAATALLTSILGFNDVFVGLMIALYIATDCFGTACNVCGDGAIAMTVDALIRDTKNPDDMEISTETAE